MDDQKETPEGRALHYAHWHAEAYGCAAPLDEVVAQVMIRHGMKGKDATKLLMDMETAGKVVIQDKDGQPCVVPNTPISGGTSAA